MTATPADTWFTAQELADLRLPALPTTKRRINELARAEGWPDRPATQPGGGREYPVSALPPAARMALAERQGQAAVQPATDLGGSAADRAEAARRALVLDHVEQLIAATGNVDRAVRTAAEAAGVSKSSVYNWCGLVRGLPRGAWAPVLLPQRRGGGRRAEIADEAWQIYRSDWLRPEQPTHQSCYRRLEAWARQAGVTLPHPKTFQRRIEQEVPREVIVAKRQGREAVRRMLPPQTRSVAGLSAMSLVNIDGHKFDVFVALPDGRVVRPTLLAIQDVYSRKMLAWRIGESESAELTRLAFADLFRDWGVPEAVLMDNGRAFASKWITGGATSRFRFKVLQEEPLGLLTRMGIQNHWATPYRGQSKPIERAFRDFCDAISRHPAFAGAWAGNKPGLKPENYGSRAVPLDLFKAVVKQGIAEHNARAGRRTETAAGRSFDEVFAESYSAAIIRKALPEELRMALLGADRVRTNRQTGGVTLFRNIYWCEAMSPLAGQQVVVRFDPDDLTQPVHIYDLAERYLLTAPIWAAEGFLDVDSARRRARLEADLRRSVRRQVELQDLLSAQQVAALLPDYPDEQDRPSPRVVRPVRMAGGAAAAARDPQADDEFMARFSAGVSRLRPVRE